MEEERLSSDALSQVLVQLSGVLLSEQTLDNVLELVTTLTQRTIGNAGVVSVTLTRDGVAYTPNSTSQLAVDLDEVQYAAGRGPCVEVASGKRPRANEALVAMQTEWPELAAAAMKHGFESMLSSPLTVSGKNIGALNVYGRNGRRFSEADETTAGLLAEQAAVVLANAIAFAGAATLNDQLREALDTRDTIGQAKGILMERQGCNADEAFDILRRASQRTNRKLRDVALEVISLAGLRGAATP